MSTDFRVHLFVVVFFVLSFVLIYDPFSRVALTPSDVAAADACVRDRLRAAASEGDSKPLLKLDMKNAVRACEDLQVLKAQQDALSGSAE